MKNFIVLFLTFITIQANAQSLYPFGFERDFATPVRLQNNDTLKFAWIGGLNAVQFAEMDINLDGINDLIVFDRHGNVLLPFINLNTQGQFPYHYAPEYRSSFPQDITDWIITYDFNHDGKMDIFTYAVGGIKVFKNISTATELKFELWSNMLNSLIYTNYINIYLTDMDFPVITDVDDDGDVDILAFYMLGNFVELHKNMGVELHGNPDTMNFHRDDRCFGNFMESDNSNVVFLNITCPWQKYANFDEEELQKNNLHVGSTMLFIDTNGDGLKDLLLGDTDYPTINRLINGGSVQSAHFVSQEVNFPSNTQHIELFSIPVLSHIDINNDGIKELIASPFDPSPIINETEKSIWLYQNSGTNNNWNLSLVKENFLQEWMIEHGSGAYPVVQDWNGDGLPDLFVANYGTRDSSWYTSGFLYSSYTSSIALYENTGTLTNPSFKLITKDFANISQLGLIAVFPAFADLDGDGDIDMVIGNREGTLLYFNNTAGAGNPMNMVLQSQNWLGIDVGLFSTPVFFDLTKNGLPDLIVGQRMGYLSYWQNTGSATSPLFTHITDTLGQVCTSDLTYSYYGHSVPCFYRNNQGETFLFAGSNRGWILHYKNIDNNLNGTFQLIDTVFIASGNDKFKIYEGYRSAPWIHDLNNDGFPEMIIGNFRGGLSLFKGITPPPDTVGIEQLPEQYNIVVFPNPFNNYFIVKSQSKPFYGIVEMYSIDGKLVYNEQINNELSLMIHTNTLPEGMYFLNIYISTENFHVRKTYKLVKIANN